MFSKYGALPEQYFASPELVKILKGHIHYSSFFLYLIFFVYDILKYEHITFQFLFSRSCSITALK